MDYKITSIIKTFVCMSLLLMIIGAGIIVLREIDNTDSKPVSATIIDKRVDTKTNRTLLGSTSNSREIYVLSIRDSYGVHDISVARDVYDSWDINDSITVDRTEVFSFTDYAFDTVKRPDTSWLVTVMNS